ncbi:MAG: efflux RND transporter periplasmic adaptor subunit [Chloroflexi bacterium]|nr:efflux RND transporter periplasmic adaptor subunit [Chloroflexota bacterium]
MRRALIIIVVLAAIAAGGWFGYQRYTAAKSATGPDYEVIPISRGNIVATVSATGAVQPERQANLTFQGTGIIANLAVKVGNPVKVGQVLAQLDTKDLELVMRQAQISLRTAQAQVQQLTAQPNASDLAASQAALASTQAAYQQLLNGADADQQAAARAAVEQAKVVLNQAQQAYDKIKDMPNAGMLPPALQLQQATINHETAQANFRVATRGANQAQLSAAQAQVAQAQAALDRLQRGASKEQIEIAQSGVDQAQLAVEQAQRRLDNARLVAPWAGIVTAVNIVEGAIAPVSLPAVLIADTSQLHINVQVDEVDIADINPDQPVTIELDALPDRKLSGHVDKVAPAASVDATGTTSYQVTIHFDPTDALLRPGMSATATIVASSRKDVLLVPNRAILFDRSTGRAFVERLADGAPQEIEVRLGLRDEEQSEVREGLADNDQIVIRNLTSRQQLQQSFSSRMGGG